MKKLSFFLLSMLFCVLFSISVAETTTVMIYLCGSNLESEYGAATKDIDEMINSGLDTTQTKVVLLIGGSSSWENGFEPNKTGIATIRTTPKGNTQLMFLETIEYLNMGESETLQYLLNYGVSNFPSDRYALILWNHGGGPNNGICWDENSDSDNLSMEELVSALATGPFAKQKLSWIGFDACLMGTLEVASALSEYADYMIASEETEPGNGWCYDFLCGLESDANGAETGRRIIDLYHESQRDSGATLTLSCLDLSRIHEVSALLNQFYSKITFKNLTDNFQIHSAARRQAHGFGRTYGLGTDYDLVDLKALISNDCFSFIPEKETLLTALDKMVVYNRSNTNDCHGLSVYYPFYSPEYYTNELKPHYASRSVSSAYTGYITDFVKLETGEAFCDWSGLITKNLGIDSELVNQYSLHLTEEQIANLADAEFLSLGQIETSKDSSYFLISRSDSLFPDENGQLVSAYSGQALYAANGVGPIPYTRTDDGHYRIYAVCQRGILIPCLFDLVCNEDNTVVLNDIYVWDNETETYSNRNSFSLEDQDLFTLFVYCYYPTYDDNGLLLGFNRWKSENSSRGYQIKGKSELLPFCFSDEQFTSSQPFVTFQVTDRQNNSYCSDLQRFEVDHIFQSYASGVIDCEWPLKINEASIEFHKINSNVFFLLSLNNDGDSAVTFQLDSGLAINGTLYPAYFYKHNNEKANDSYRVTSQLNLSNLLNLQNIHEFTVFGSVSTDESSYPFQITLTPEQFPDVNSLTPKINDHVLGAGTDGTLSIEVYGMEYSEDTDILEFLCKVTNDSDQSIHAFDYSCKFMADSYSIKGKPSDGPSRIPAHTSIYQTFVLDNTVCPTTSDGSKLHSGDFLQRFGISDITSLTISDADHSITIHFEEPIKLPAKEFEKPILLFDYKGVSAKILEMQVIPDGENYLIGVLMNVSTPLGTSYQGYSTHWLMNGEMVSPESIVSERSTITKSDNVTSITDWLFIKLNTYPSDGLQEIGFNQRFENFVFDKVSIDFIISLDDPLPTPKQSIVIPLSSLHTSLVNSDAVSLPYNRSIPDAPCGSGVLYLDEMMLPVEIAGLQQTDTGDLSGWLHITNTTGTNLKTFALLPLVDINNQYVTQQITPFIIDLPDGASSWQSFILSSPSVILEDGSRVFECKDWLQLFGIDSINHFASATVVNRNIEHLELTLTDPFIVEQTATYPPGALIEDYESVQTTIERIGFVTTDGEPQILILVRYTNNHPTSYRNVNLYRGSWALNGVSKLSPGSTMLVMYNFPLESDTLEEIPLTLYYSGFGGDAGEEFLLLFKEPITVTDQVHWLNEDQFSKYIEDDEVPIPVTIHCDETDLISVSNSAIEWKDGRLGVAFTVTNLTDRAQYGYTPGVICNDVIVNESVSFDLKPGESKNCVFFLNSIDDVARLSKLILPMVLSVHHDDVLNYVGQRTNITINTDVDVSSICKTHSNVFGTGVATFAGITCHLDLMDVVQNPEDGSVDFIVRIMNDTDQYFDLPRYNLIAYSDEGKMIGNVSYRDFQRVQLPQSTCYYPLKLDNQVSYMSFSTEEFTYSDIITQLKIDALNSLHISSKYDDSTQINLQFNKPFSLLSTSDYSNGSVLFSYNGVTTELLAMRLIGRPEKTSHLCLVIRSTNDSTQSVEPFVYNWIINGEPIRKGLFEATSLNPGEQGLTVLQVELPSDIKIISSLSLDMGLTYSWGSITPAIIELPENGLVMPDGITEYPGESFNVIPAEF